MSSNFNVIDRAELGHRIPGLIKDFSTVAIVSHTPEGDWAAATAWEIARASATVEHNVTLIDLSLDRPTLDVGSGAPSGEGIVDVLLYGASLSHVTLDEGKPGLQYVGVGTFAPNPSEILVHSRWPQIVEATSRTDSTIIFFLPGAALPLLNVPLDGLIILSPHGYQADAPASSPSINQAVEKGIRHIATITGTLEVIPETPPNHLAEEFTPPAPASGNRVKVVYAALGLTALASMAYTIFGGGPAAVSPEGDGPQATASVTQPSIPDAGVPVAAPLTDNTVIPDTTSSSPAPVFSDADSLFWGVQLASLGSLESAMSFGDRLEADGFIAIITPIQLQTGQTMHRVIAGAVPDSAAASTLQARLWATPHLQTNEGRIIRTTLALEVESSAGDDPDRQISSLREIGISAYILPAADGAHRILVGAFHNERQARVVDATLTASGYTTTLITRMGNSQ